MDGIPACGAIRISTIYHFILVSKEYGSNSPFVGENLFCLWNYAVPIILRGRFSGISDRLTEEASGELVKAK